MDKNIFGSGKNIGLDCLNSGDEDLGKTFKCLDPIKEYKPNRGHKYIKSCLSGNIDETSIVRKKEQFLSISSKILNLKKLELIPKKEELNNCLGLNNVKNGELDRLQFNEGNNKEMKFIQKSEKIVKKKKIISETNSRSSSKIRTSPVLSTNKLLRLNSFSPKNLELGKNLDINEKVNDKSENPSENPLTLRIPHLNIRKNSEVKFEDFEKSKKSGLKNVGVHIKPPKTKNKASGIFQTWNTQKRNKKENDQKKLKTSKSIKSRNHSKNPKKSKKKALTQAFESTSKKVRFDEESNNYIPIAPYTVESEISDSENSLVDHWVDIMLVSEKKCGPSEFVHEFESNLKNNNCEIFKKLHENCFEETDLRLNRKFVDSDDKHISQDNTSESMRISVKSSNFS